MYESSHSNKTKTKSTFWCSCFWLDYSWTIPILENKGEYNLLVLFLRVYGLSHCDKTKTKSTKQIYFLVFLLSHDKSRKQTQKSEGKLWRQYVSLVDLQEGEDNFLVLFAYTNEAAFPEHKAGQPLGLCLWWKFLFQSSLLEVS